MRLDQLASLLGCRIEGDASLEINGVASLDHAGANDLSFFANPKYRNALASTKAGAIIVGAKTTSPEHNLLKNDNPYLAFAKAIEVFHKKHAPIPVIHPSARVSASAVLGSSVSVAAGAFVGERAIIEDRAHIGEGAVVSEEARIGEDTVVNAGCVVGARVQIGRRCFLDFNCVIGAEGFAYARNEDGSWYRILQAGDVVLEDDVGIGACTCIARATVGETRIKQGAKIDALVQVGHGSVVGRNSLLCAQVGLAGSTRIGDWAILAGQVGVAGHLTIGDRVQVAAQSGIGTSIPDDSAVGGSPSFERARWLRAISVFKNIPELQTRVSRLEKKIRSLEKVLEV